MDYVSQEQQGKAGTPEQAQRREGLCLNTAMVGLCSGSARTNSHQRREASKGNLTGLGSASHIMSYGCIDGNFTPLAW